jgi:Cft2 family RNA processing exonuclease
MRDDYFLALGGGDEIGASSYLLHIDGVRVLIDAGIRHDRHNPYPDFERLCSIGRPHALLLTHAHADHVGGLGKLWAMAAPDAMFCTAATRDLVKTIGARGNAAGSDELAEDTATLRSNFRNAVSALEILQYGSPQLLAHDCVQATPIRAGHILGAASYVLDFPSHRVLVTGDIALHDQRAVGGFDVTALPTNVDVLVIEATYAYQPASDAVDYTMEQHRLTTRVAEVLDAGGRVLIPAFSLGRAQEIAALFADAFADGELSPFPVLLDGMTRDVCAVYERHRGELMRRRRRNTEHCIYNAHVQPAAQTFKPTATALAEMPPQCIVASSGMLMPGSRSAEYAAHMRNHPRDAIFFSGYLDDESPGRRLLDMHRSRTGALIDSYRLSAHAAAADLRELIREVNARLVILVHGNFHLAVDAAFLELELELEQRGVRMLHAQNGTAIDL